MLIAATWMKATHDLPAELEFVSADCRCVLKTTENALIGCINQPLVNIEKVFAEKVSTATDQLMSLINN